jgi:ADP-ribosylglycohydrolase
MTPQEIDRYTGCMLGLAIGDALGYPAEFRSREQIQREIGPRGITGFLASQDPRFSRPIIVGTLHPPGTFTDDTQMSIAVAEGLLEAGAGAELDVTMETIARRFIDWSRSPDNNRSPGATCMRGCENLARGISWREAGVAESKGCGSAMRVAPIGLFYDDLDWVETVARASSLLTHGHDAALEGAAAAALMVTMALRDMEPSSIHVEIGRRLGQRSADFDQRWAQVPEVLTFPPERALSKAGLGEGWVAEEAVASAMYCFWRHPDDYGAAVLEAINTDGDSDSIGAIAGSVSAARLGRRCIPVEWSREVEAAGSLMELGEQLFHARR